MIECITVSVNYSDYLNFVIRQNKKFFTRWLIATVSSDRNTIDICNHHHIEHILCDDVIHLNDAKFNKGAILNKAYNHLSRRDWILHIDSDIILPHNFHQVAGNTHIYDKSYLYGMHRWQIPNRQSAESYVSRQVDFPSGCSRIVYDDGAIGYFQMFHHTALASVAPKNQFYSDLHGNAAHSDVEFRDRFRRINRERYIEHFDVFHLGPTGQNWDGRKSPTF